MASSAMLFVIICYDVATETPAGRRRLRRVAKLCEAVGQRVQKSVFECRADLARLEALERELLAEIEPATDALRFYRLTEPVSMYIKEYGCFKATDFTAPLVL